jgi:hypothetical protein
MKKLALSFLSLVLLGSLCLSFVSSAMAGPLAGLIDACGDGLIDRGSYVECTIHYNFRDWDRACNDLGGTAFLNPESVSCDLY